MSWVEQLLPSKQGACKYNCWCRIYRSHRARLALHEHDTVTTCCIQSWIKLTLWLSGQRNSVTSRSNEYSDYKVESQFDWSRFSQHVSAYACCLTYMLNNITPQTRSRRMHTPQPLLNDPDFDLSMHVWCLNTTHWLIMMRWPTLLTIGLGFGFVENCTPFVAVVSDYK